MDLNIINLYPDDPVEPRSWTSDCAGLQVVLLGRGEGAWAAKLERRTIATAPTVEQLAAHLYGEYGLLTVLNANEITA